MVELHNAYCSVYSVLVGVPIAVVSKDFPLFWAKSCIDSAIDAFGAL